MVLGIPDWICLGFEPFTAVDFLEEECISELNALKRNTPRVSLFEPNFWDISKPLNALYKCWYADRRMRADPVAEISVLGNCERNFCHLNNRARLSRRKMKRRNFVIERKGLSFCCLVFVLHTDVFTTDENQIIFSADRSARSLRHHKKLFWHFWKQVTQLRFLSRKSVKPFMPKTISKFTNSK